MTCIIGLENGGVVWMGGDSAGTAGNMHQRVRRDKKVFVRGEFLFGFCGSFRMGQLLKHKLVLPEKQQGGNDVSYMVNEFVTSVRNCLEEENKNLSDEDKLTPYFLVGYRGKLYNIQPDYQVAQAEDGFEAVGSGADIAIGAMHASKSVKNCKKRITQALEASARNNAAVRPPYTILSLKNGDFGDVE
jgi:ATP-dependent protease HslVU (ClpYQ) peptidase subunit